MDKSNTILVVLVTYNGAKWLEGVLSPFEHCCPGVEVLVIDNGSTDGTLNTLRSKYKYVQVVANERNLGFGAANNIGLRKVSVEGYRGAFLLNQDASIEPTAILTLADYAERDTEKSIGLASPLHLSRDGSLERGFVGNTKLQGYDAESNEAIYVPFVNAALWYLPCATLRMLGFFDSLFYHYGEDKDYYNRLLAAGLKGAVYPSVKGYHYRLPESLPPAKRDLLEEVYHLTEWINPCYHNPLQRLIRGPVALLFKGKPVAAIRLLSKRRSSRL